MILALSIYTMLPVKFQDNRLLFKEKKQKIDFQDGGHLGLPIGTILAIVIYMLPRSFLPSFMSVGLSVQEKKLKVDW